MLELREIYDTHTKVKELIKIVKTNNYITMIINKNCVSLHIRNVETLERQVE